MKRLLIVLIVGAVAAIFLGVSSPTFFASSPTRSGIFCASAFAQDDDILKMYEQYLTPQEQALLDRFEESQQRSEEAQAVKHTRQ